MGDRFYEAQKGSNRAAAKPKRILKADIVKSIEAVLGVNLPNLVKTDAETLTKLNEAVYAKII